MKSLSHCVVRKIKISIIAPFWKTNLAYISYFLFIFGLLFTFYKTRVNILKQRQAELEKTVDIRTKDLQESEKKLKILNENQNKI